MGKTPTPTDLDVVVTHKRHGSTYMTKKWFLAREFSDSTRDWIWPALFELVRRSRLTPISSSVIGAIHRGLAIADKLPAWAALVATSPRTSTVESVIAFFSEFESTLQSREDISPVRATILSMKIRHFIKNYLLQESADPRIGRLPALYRPRLNTRHEGRLLISDLPNQGRPPISAVRFSTYAELRNRFKKIIEGDLIQIRKACVDQMTRYLKAIEVIDVLRKTHLTKRDELRLRSILAVKHMPKRWSNDDIKILLVLYAKVQAKQVPPIATTVKTKYRVNAQITKEVQQHFYGVAKGKNLGRELCIDTVLPAEVLLACALCIQLHTCWNFSSVLALTSADIEIGTFPHVLQSIKPKTQDHTPRVLVEKKDEDVVLALTILSRRLQNIADAGLVKKSEISPWARGPSTRRSLALPLSEWRTPLRKLQKAYGLPEFTYEQVRVQCLAAISDSREGLESAMFAAGHASEITTFAYVNKALAQRRNAANALEFEQRLDATIRYMLDPQAVAEDQELIAYPIGDGTSCRSPYAPPIPEWLDAGICRATSCHVEDGCVNRLIVITQERIEEVVRTKKYYESSWLRLASENEVAFEQHQLPSMLFNFALYGVLARGPYRHLVRSYEHQISLVAAQ